MTVNLFYFKQYHEADGTFTYGIREFIPSDVGQYENTIFAGEQPRDIAHKIVEIMQELSGQVTYQNQKIATQNTLPLDSIEQKEVANELERILREDSAMTA